MTRLLGGTHHLANETLRAPDALIAVPDAAGSDPKLIVTRGHSEVTAEIGGRWRSRD
jgi:hypothetical protein